MEDLQDINDNISDEQDPVSTSLKVIISKMKTRNKLRLRIQQKGLGSCSRIPKGANWG